VKIYINYKNIFIILLVIIVVIISFNARSLYYRYFTIYGTYYDAYNLKIPKPQDIIKELYKIGPLGEGETYTILMYNQEDLEEVRRADIWEKITDNNYEQLKERISKYQDHVISTWDKDPFKEYPFPIEEDNLYYLKLKEDNSWLLATLKEDKIYIIEEAW